MPITQDRLLSIINMAASLRGKLRQSNKEFSEDAGNSTLDQDQIINRHLSRIRRLAVEEEESDIIAAELMHARFTEHRNRRAAAKKRAQRGTATDDDKAFLHQVNKYPAFRRAPRQKPAYEPLDDFTPAQIAGRSHMQDEPLDADVLPAPIIRAPKAKSGETDAEYIARRNAEPRREPRQEPTIAPEPPGTNLAAVGYPPTWDNDDGELHFSKGG
jgi:hypothetical protein